MAAEYSANTLQTVPANGPVIFSESPVPCNRGIIFHRDESGLFRLASPRVMGVSCRPCCRCVMAYPESVYDVAFHANIAVPGTPAGTVEEIQLAIFIDGEEDPSSIMSFTPAAVDEFGNVGANILVSVPCICGCSSVSVRNISTQPVNVQNANIVFNFAGVRR